MFRTPPPRFFQVLSTTSMDTRRITFEPDSLLVEMRQFVGSYQPCEEVFWDEVRAIYTWTAPNWNAFVGTSLVLLLVGFITMAAAANNPAGIWTVLAVMALAA